MRKLYEHDGIRYKNDLKKQFDIENENTKNNKNIEVNREHSNKAVYHESNIISLCILLQLNNTKIIIKLSNLTTSSN